MAITRITKKFLFHHTSDILKNNMEAIQDAALQDINSGMMLAQMEIARQLDRIANALEKD